MIGMNLRQSKALIFAGLFILCVISDACGNARQEAQVKLEKARENLRINQAAEEQIASELEKLKNSAEATPEIIEDHQAYLNRVHAIVTENQKIVNALEETYSKGLETAKAAGVSKAAQSERSTDTGIPEDKEHNNLDRLDRELADSLGEFDEMLLKEMDEILVKSEKRMKDLTAEAEAAAKRLQEKAAEAGSASEETESAGVAQESGSEQAQKEGQQGQGKPAKGKEGTKVTGNTGSDARSQSGDDAASGRGVQPRVGDQDDDIVARQLREAAEQETDPELKEKLWKEYEDYKKGGS